MPYRLFAGQILSISKGKGEADVKLGLRIFYRYSFKRIWRQDSDIFIFVCSTINFL